MRILRISAFLIFGLLTTLDARAQNEVQVYGVVQIVDSVHTGVSITASRVGALSYYDITSSDEGGQYSLSIAKGDSVAISFFFLGYRDSTVLVKAPQRDSMRLPTVFLQPSRIALPSVFIKDKRSVLRRSGDTTIIDHRYYQKGVPPANMLDAMLNIPGVELRGDHLYYHNKRIDDLLLEGNIIARGEEAELLRGLLYESVNNVDVIHNYDPHRRGHKDHDNERIAMNLDLKAVYRDRIQVSLEGQAGVKRRYDVSSQAVKAGKKKAIRLRVSSQNLQLSGGDQELSTVVQKELDQFLYQGRWTLAFGPDLDNLLNQRNLVPNKFSDSKISLSTAKNDEHWVQENAIQVSLPRQNAVYREEFLNTRSLSSVEGRGETSLRGLDLHGRSSADYRGFDNIHLKVELQGRVEQINAVDAALRSSEEDIWQYESNDEQTTYTFSPRYDLTADLSSKLELRLYGRGLLSRRTKSNNLTAIAFEGLYDQLEISATQESFDNYLKAQYKHGSIKVVFLASAHNGVTSLERSPLAINAFSTDTTDRDSWQIINATTGLLYDQGQWRALLGVQGAKYRRDTDLSDFKGANEVGDIYFLLMRRLQGQYGISVSYKPEWQVVDYTSFGSLAIPEDATALRQGAGVAAVRTSSFSASFFRLPQMETWPVLLNTSISYSPYQTTLQPVFSVADGYLLREVVSIRMRSVAFNALLQKTSREFSYSFQTVYNRSRQKSSTMGAEDLLASASYTRTLLGQLKVGGLVSYHRMLTLGRGGLAGAFTNTNVGLQASYWQGNWRTRAQLSQLLQNSGEAFQLRQWQMSLLLEYTLQKKGALFLNVSNPHLLGGVSAITSRMLPFQIEERLYQGLGGFITAGFKGAFADGAHR